jgi:hypothetical protein
MGLRDPRVDAYIARAAEFARPVLSHLRRVVHRACPEVVEEMKWGAPHFNYRGMFCGMAAFKGHCVFGFWKAGLVGLTMPDRITTLKDLPSEAVLTRAVKKAMKLNEDGVKAPRPARKPKPPVVVPKDLKEGLARSARARATFEAFPPSHRREYVEWITEAKTAATRERRLATTLEWLAEGKSRNWKYEKC